MDSKIPQAEPNDKWLPRFQANLWAHYTWVVHVYHPRGREVIDRRLDRQTTKRRRAELAGTGMVSRKKVPTTDEARRAQAATLDACQPHPCVMWLDNYNKQRFSKNPGVVPSKANRRTAPAEDTKRLYEWFDHGHCAMPWCPPNHDRAAVGNNAWSCGQICCP